MKQLFRRLSLAYPLILTERELNRLIALKERRVLSQLGILGPGKPLDAVECKTCSTFHEIHVQSDERIFYVCPDGGKESVNPQDINTWTVRYGELFDSLSKGLGFDSQVVELREATLWRLGTTQVDNAIIPVFFSREKVAEPSKTPQEITIVASHQPSKFVSDDTRLVIALEDILADNANRGLWSKRKWASLLTNRSRKTIFDSNGDLIVDGKRIAAISPSSPPYYFVEALNNKYNLAVSQDDIFSYCEQKIARQKGTTEWKSEYTPQSFCNKMKALIKHDAIDKKMIDQVIKHTRTTDGKNAYRLTRPD